MRPGKLLVLDEDESIHAMVEMSVGDLVEVIHATSPQHAWHLLEKEEIGVILAERRLGNMDITRLLGLFKRQQPRLACIVLGRSGAADPLDRMPAPGQIYHYLEKPVAPGLLRLTLKSALTGDSECFDAPPTARRAVLAQGASARPPSIIGFMRGLFGS